jgi:hypothetical protein
MLLILLRRLNKMSFVKLPANRQRQADISYDLENQVIKLIHELDKLYGKHRWFSIGRTDIEKGLMALRKGITESFKEKCDNNDKLFEEDKEEVTHIFVVGNSPWDPR